jgi:hypothetical protein
MLQVCSSKLAQPMASEAISADGVDATRILDQVGSARCLDAVAVTTRTDGVCAAA